MKYIHMFLTATLFLSTSSIIQSTPMLDETRRNEQQISCCDRKKTMIADIVKIVSKAQEKTKQGDIGDYNKNKLISLLWSLVYESIRIEKINTVHNKKKLILLEEIGFELQALYNCGLLCLVSNMALYFLPIMQSYKQIGYTALNTSLPLCGLYFLIQTCISISDIMNISLTEKDIQSELAQSLGNITVNDISDIPTAFLDRAMNMIESYASDCSLLSEQVLFEIKENIQNDKAEIEAHIKNL